MSIELRLGRWQDVLPDVECDALITDPPYSARTHEGHNGTVGRGGKRRVIDYALWGAEDVAAFVASWAPRTRGWFVAFTSHDLAPVYASELERLGRYVFAPLPWVAHGSRVRLSGDGPSSWTCWIVVARPRNAEFMRWGTLPGAYLYGAHNHATLAHGAQQERVIGGKPLDLMRAIVRDYSRPGDLVCDPCAGGGTTLLAACLEGRRSIGAEMDQETHAKATARLHPEMPLLDWGGVRVEQGRLDLAGGARG